MSDECPRCRDFAASGGRFCGACGRYLGGGDLYQTPANDPRPAEKTHLGFLETVLLSTCIFLMFVAVFQAFTMLVNFSDVWSYLSIMSSQLHYPFPFIVIVPYPHIAFYLGDLGESAILVYWALLAIIILLCLAIAVWKFINAAKSGGLAKGAAENTAIFWVSISLCAMYSVNFIVVVLTAASGSDITVPDLGSKLWQMYSLADAAVWEEIIARVMYIGIPMAVISFIITKKKESLKCILGGFGMSATALVLIVISGAIFGIAHYPGWENQLWKVFTAGLMGAFLGYVFVRFGLYAAILLHFINDYLSAFDWMGVGGFTVLVALVLLAVGFVALVYVLIRVLDKNGTIRTLPLFKNLHIKTDEQVL